MGILSALKNFFTKKARSLTLNKKAYFAGSIIKSSYFTQFSANYDRNPLALILFSGLRQTIKGNYHYTHALNLNALGTQEKSFILQTIITIIKTKTVPTPQAFYLYLKSRYPIIIKRAYRTYFTAYLNGRYVSPGFSFANIPLVRYADSFIYQLNKLIMGENILHKNSIKGEDKIKEYIATNILKDKINPKTEENNNVR